MSNTKQEMLHAYNDLLKQMQKKEKTKLKPEKKIKEIVNVADSVSSEGVVKGISNLKLEMEKMLTQISDRLEGEVSMGKREKGFIRSRSKNGKLKRRKTERGKMENISIPLKGSNNW
ncbi:MAG: hypothetical protein SWO11_10445 [Thermodesulfobacteriota bacterium]|nr:hypothetical protein [Thermodesulfobacteriota bacterium]